MNLLALIGLLAQSVTYTAPVAPTPGSPGKVVAVAGSLTCTAAGNASPATSLTISCVDGTVSVITAQVNPLMNSTSRPQFGDSTNDSVMFVITTDGSGNINVQAVTTVAGGAPSTATGGAL